MTRRVYLLGIGLALVSLALIITEAAVTPRAGITPENFQRIRKGMTLAEVRRILGSPTGGPHLGRGRGTSYWWEEGNHRVIASFGPADRLLEAFARFNSETLIRSCRDEQPPSLFEKLRVWLSW
jgi:hypothetical protein